VSGISADAIPACMGLFELVDDQRAAVGLGRVGRPVARFSVGLQPVAEELGRQATRR
jgi:hypothetical protein